MTSIHGILILLLRLSFISTFLFSPIWSIKYLQNSPTVACELSINELIVGDCQFNNSTGNSSKSLVVVQVGWIDMAPGDIIECSFFGQTEFIDPFDLSCPSIVTFVVTPDGSTSLLEIKTTSGNCISVDTMVTLPSSCDPPICLAGQHTGGKVFLDYNGDGIQDASEEGLPNVEVDLYGKDSLLGRTLTGINGHWATDTVAAGTPIRIEFKVPAGLFDGSPGVQSHTRVQIGVAGNCDYDLGIFARRSFVDANPWIATTCFAKGSVIDSNSQAAQEPTLVLNRYFTAEGGPRVGPDGNYYLANAYETGSVWGLSYQRESRMLYAAAFLKRQAALGPDGLGAIYQISMDDFFPNPPPSTDYRYFDRSSLLLNLDDYGIETGDESVLVRDLPATPNAFSHDSMVFDLVAKWGLGDMDMSTNGDSLFVVNLYNQSLVIIELGNPAVLPITPDRVHEVAIPNPACTMDSDWRPWGLKYYDDRLYVGGVCSAESSQDANDLSAHIYSFQNGVFDQVVNFNLNYTKGPAVGNDCRNFKPWSSDFNKYKVRNDVVCGPSPLLCDIEFDAGGHMILGLGDRFAYQTGGRDYGPDTRDKLGYISFTGGDILRLFRIKGEFILEKNAQSGYTTTAGANNNQGVCGGEFYYEDAFLGHQESILGALAVHPSYNAVLATIMDPTTIWSNGWSQFDNSTGQKISNYSIFAGELGTFGKAAGLGDIEIMSGSSIETGVQLSIGNYVWLDDDLDGIQGPDEPPFINLEVVLYDNNGLEIKNTLTDSSGLYYFHDLQPHTNYHIVLGRSAMYTQGKLILNGLSLSPTQPRVRQGYGNLNNDSDGFILGTNNPGGLQGLIGTAYTTGGDFENDFSVDFGLTQCLDIEPHRITLNICEGDSISFRNKWYSQSVPYHTLILEGEAMFGCDSIIFIQVETLPTTTATFDTTICPGAFIAINGEVFDSSRPSGQIILENSNLHGCDSIVQVEVSFFDTSLFHMNVSICQGDTLTVDGEIFHESRAAGRVLLPGSNHFGCDSTIMVQVEILENTSADLDTILCPGEEIIIGGEVFNETRRSGTVYFQNANQYGCDSSVNVQLTYPSNWLRIPPVYEIEYGDSVQLQPSWDLTFIDFAWTPDYHLNCLDCPYPWASPLETTTYYLNAQDINGCWYATQTLVKVKKEKSIWAPNVFSPNGDNINDHFTIYANPFLEIIEELLIFDRWGELVFQTNNIPPNISEVGWDGYLNREPMNPAVFVFVANVRWKDGERQTLHGDVTLVR